ncbi:MAG TPA: ATP-binding protein [Desulfobacteria bacterium]|nr:ATP-binding protein [Desulfobacteria bacterium]
MPNDSQFTFEISLSVLNHLGRNLYRSFITVLGEAISNSWDADAENVWIYVNREENYLVIKDDGDGMTADDFQNKFLKIGYSKRKEGKTSSDKGRPYIGRKGIGKLAMLSCADKISIISKKANSDYIGGTIDNSGLDEAINQDLTPQEYALGTWEEQVFSNYIENHSKGTIVYFDNLIEGIKNTIDYLKYAIALYFRFSLIDSDFNIYLNEEKVTIEDLDKLADRTQFLWIINSLEDPYINRLHDKFNILEEETLEIDGDINGFIASVETPTHLKVLGTEEKASIDLFVNGRLRERDIIKHIPTARIPENYLYGQIHYDDLDDENDRFATSREGIKADDPKYEMLLDKLKKQVINKIIDQWDKWRRDHRKPGDSENKSIPPKERKARELFNFVSDEYSLPKESEKKGKVAQWVDALADDAQFNFTSYADCFVSENLIRKYIEDKAIELSPEAIGEITDKKTREKNNKNRGNISIDIRRTSGDLSYLSMDGLANLVDKEDPITKASLSRDAREYKPIRDALAHTALLTDIAKVKLTTVYENIRGRVRTLLSGK